MKRFTYFENEKFAPEIQIKFNIVNLFSIFTSILKYCTDTSVIRFNSYF